MDVNEFADQAGLDRPVLETRMDSEDLNTIAEMIQLGTDYISEQDESDDAANIPRMQAIVRDLSTLIPVEVSEDEPPEDEGDDG